MNILAIDTSGPYLSCAIAKGDKVVARFDSKKERSHSDMLASAVERLLAKARLKPKDIDLYAVSIGPGSFTGLRIGVAFIKGMNLFFNRPVVAVPTLDVMASIVDGDVVCPVVDAKRQNVYTAIYKRVHQCTSAPVTSFKRILKYSVIPIAEVLEKLKSASGVVFTGDAIDIYKDEITKALASKAFFAPKRLWHTGADSIAKTGFRMYNQNKGVARDLRRLKPMYLYPRDIQCRGPQRQK
jgi:tRNA threonylcarbamoyladenosine biosynthesis protein TsaB